MNTEEASRFDRDPPNNRRTALDAIAAQPIVFGVATIASTIVLLVSLAAVVLSAAAEEILQSLRTSTELLVLIKPEASKEQIEGLRQSAAALSNVADVKLTQADGVMRAVSTGGELGLKEVPAILRVRAGSGALALAEWTAAVRDAMKSSTIVDVVRVDSAWVVAVDGWTKTWLTLRSTCSVGIALCLALLIGSIWILATRATPMQYRRASAYITFAGLAVSTIVCALLWLIIQQTKVGFLRPTLVSDLGLNALFVMVFALVCGLSATVFARHLR